MSNQRPILYVEPVMPRWWNIGIVAMTLSALGLIFIDLGLDPMSRASQLIGRIDMVLCLFFLGDFVVRFRKATHKWKFLRRNWVDLLGSIPMLDALRTVRLVRIVRIIRFTRVAGMVIRLLRRRGVRVPTGALGTLGLVTAVMWVIAAVLFYYFEHGTNDGIKGLDDALWWSMTTLSTVGYGDLYPGTDGGRLVAGATMVVGIGVLGTLAATIASAFIEVRERARRGLRSYALKDHLLVLGWNSKSELAILEFHQDPRFADRMICIVAELDESPIDDPQVRFVRGSPSQRDSLKKASPGKALAAIIFARDPTDTRSDHETALSVHMLRRLNKECRISAELVDPKNREHFVDAGCDSIVDVASVVTGLLVRSVQDVGVTEVVGELISNTVGCEIYRVRVADEYVGKTYHEYAKWILGRGCCVLGVQRGGKTMVNPALDVALITGDEAFVVSHDPIST